IEQYEREIRELKSQQPYQELQAAIRQKEVVEAELAEVKSCLATIMAMVQPVLARPPGFAGHHPGPSLPVSQPQQQQQQPPLGPTSSFYPDSASGSAASPAASVGTTQGRWHSSASPIVPPASIDGQHQHHSHQEQSPQIGLLNNQRQRHDHLGHGLGGVGSDRLGLDFVLDPTQKLAQPSQDGSNMHGGINHEPPLHYRQDTSLMIPPPAPPSQPPPPLTLSSAVYTAHQSTTFSPSINHFHSHSHPNHTNTAIDTTSSPDFTTIHRNTPPTCPLDFLLLNTISTRRQLLVHHPPLSVLGPPYPSVASLLDPSMPSHPLSKVFTDILARFPLLSTLPERVGVLYLMFTLMRWQISPSVETWNRLPVWYRPSRLAREKEHPAWIDHIPFPEMREKIIREYEVGKFPFDNFFIPFTSTLCVNWPYEEVDEEEREEEEEEWTINPVFVRHLSRLESWTLGEEFERAHPGLVGTFRVRRGSWKPPPSSQTQGQEGQRQLGVIDRGQRRGRGE
ncbi:hypothetical protein QBC35DRAFT_388071, partial [Podospora australis]